MTAATILTLANGKGIDLLNPQSSDFADFDWLAEHLAKEARYNGATPGEIYSVAEHAVRGADAILEQTGNEVLAAYFLCHDNHEAVLKDDTTPKKRAIAAVAQEHFGVLAEQILQAFDLLTYRHDVAIHEAAGLPWPMPPVIAAGVKSYDLIMFVTEWRDLMPGVEHPNWKPYAEIPPLEHKISSVMVWPDAKRAWLYRAHKLLPALKARAA